MKPLVSDTLDPRVSATLREPQGDQEAAASEGTHWCQELR